MTSPAKASDPRAEDVAIIGMAGRFPGAANVDAFWANLRDGVESIRRLTDDELRAAGVSRADLANPHYVPACPVLEDVDKFDAAFFGFSPRDASVMDPAHRIFLEIAWQAVEQAGYTALPQDGPVGVFAGAGAPLYMIENLRSNPDLMRSMGEFLVRHTGNDMNFLATRVSYEMDLRGPSMNIQTACSSALVSLHQACQSLIRGECVMALAGGATVLIPQGRGYVFEEGEILSPDGRCRPFDAKSAGTVFGSGAGVVVLKRLSDALDAGDTIHAVVKGSAINNDGALKVGYLAPGVDGQAAVITAALTAAKVDADSISYIETHGTGTLVGDPIEVEALNEAYRARTDRRGFCAIGSVKSNIGHLGEAAAAASLVKAVMALKHRQLPPTLGYETPNPAIDFDNSPFFVNDTLRDWNAVGPLRCGITALGAGGTNCHVILEEAPAPLPGEGAREQQLLILSAKTKAALDRASDNLAQALEQDPTLDLADAAYTLALGRRPMPHRRVVAVKDHADAIACLRSRDAKRLVTDRAADGRPATVFMFPGGGAQYAGMGAELYAQEDVYRDAIDECLELINPALGRDMRSLMFPPAAEVERATRTLERPSLTLPSLFATEYAMARLFMSWGVTPAAFIGHSVGEYAAACLSGVMSLNDALRLVMLRGRLFESLPPGGMLSVPLSETDLLALAPEGVCVAAVNAAELSVASGPNAAIEILKRRLAEREIDSTPIRIDVAAHSSMLDAILGEFRTLCRSIDLHPPVIPFVSNVTGRWITAAQTTDPDYWVSQLRSTVRFADGLATLRGLGETTLLEVGPGRTLNMLARAQATPFRNAYNAMRHPQEAASDLAYAMTALGRMWAAGAPIDWPTFYDGQLRNRVPLPAYPFERTSFWVEPGKMAAAATGLDLVKREDITQWFYGLGFAEAALIDDSLAGASRRWLIISETPSPAIDLARRLAPDPVIVATSGASLSLARTGPWQFNFDDPEQYAGLLQAMEDHGGAPDHIVFLTAPTPRRGAKSTILGDRDLARNFLHPTYVAQALGGLSGPVQFSIVTSDLAGLDDQPLDPARALALGPIFVAPREIDRLGARCIDIPSALPRAARERVMERLIEELKAQTDDSLVALRPHGRLVQSLAPLPLPPISDGADPQGWVRDDGVYLITGGLGGIGLEVAEHLARSKTVKLALLTRGSFPDERLWDDILAGRAKGNALQVAKLRALQTLGSQVMVVTGDITNPRSLGQSLGEVRSHFGAINGVIHAAGMMDDAPLLAKTQATMTRVLAPKVSGTLALDALIREPLDVFLIFSSVASFMGLPGQVDYTAANAFLDAFAKARSRRAPGRTTVVNWNAWRDIGMAADAHRRQIGGPAPATASAHPDLDGYTDVAADRVFSTTFGTNSHWLLAEHQVKGGLPLIPGSGLVELARAAYCEGRAPGAVELSNLTFLSPFQVAQGETRRLVIQVSASTDGAEIAMRPGGDQTAAPMFTCEARPYGGASPSDLDLTAIGARCALSASAPAEGFLDQDFMAFGPRWANLRSIRSGAAEALVELSLDDSFAGDIGVYGLHPALLDMATGAVQSLIPGSDLATEFYVPLAYGSVKIFGPMPQRLFSHVRHVPGAGQGLAYFDVSLSDAEGHVFAEISRFTMKRLDAQSALSAPADQPVANQNARDAMADLLREGITPTEGFAALDRIMAQRGLVQAVASSVDVILWLETLRPKPVAREGDDDAVSAAFERPDLDTDFAAPSSALEIGLAQMWSDLLGVRQIGRSDNFFDLGGNSLVAVRLFAAIKKQFRIRLPLALLFEAPTIAALAEVLAQRGAEGSAPATQDTWSFLVKIKDGASHANPIFCVHGAQGNVLIFKSLADRLGATRPFFALQAHGVDGRIKPSECIPDMARCYVAAMKAARPHGPYLLAGYSGGGVIAYEMAQQLKAVGDTVSLILMVDTLEPSEHRIPVTMADRFRHLHRVRLSRFVALPDNLWRYHLYPRICRKLGITQVRQPLTNLEAAGQAVEAAYMRGQIVYTAAPYAGDLLIVRANDARMHFLRSGPSLGWDKYVSGRTDSFEVDADHLSVFDEPSVSRIADEMLKALKHVEARDASTPCALEPMKDGRDHPAISRHGDMVMTASHSAG